MLSVHHLANSRSQRVVWLLEELGLEYDIVEHRREPGSRVAPGSLRKIHPLGKAPVLCDGDVTIAETGAIFEYVLERHGNGRLEPARGTPERIQYIYWQHFAEASLMPYLAMKLLFAGIENAVPFFVRPAIRLLTRAVNAGYMDRNLVAEIDFIEQHLATHEWFAGGGFTAADVLIGFMLEAVSGRFAPVAAYPNIASFVNRIRARPAYRRAMQRGGWSVADHEKYWGFLAR